MRFLAPISFLLSSKDLSGGYGNVVVVVEFPDAQQLGYTSDLLETAGMCLL